IGEGEVTGGLALEGESGVEQEVVHFGAGEHGGAVVIVEAGGGFDGLGEARDKAGDGDPHDDGGDENFEEGEARFFGTRTTAAQVAACALVARFHFAAAGISSRRASSSRTIRGMPVMGSTWMERRAPLSLRRTSAMAGTVPPGKRR